MEMRRHGTDIAERYEKLDYKFPILWNIALLRMQLLKRTPMNRFCPFWSSSDDGRPEKMQSVMGPFEEAYHVIPIYWQCNGDRFSMVNELERPKIDMMHTIFLYCISPIVFKREYMDSQLNKFADIAGFLPSEGEQSFDPEKHDSSQEDACYRMVNATHKFIFFMFNILNEGYLPQIAHEIFQHGKNITLCMKESKRLSNEFFNGQIQDKRLVALFAITLAVVSEPKRWEVILARFKFLEDATANDCRKFAGIAKECVKKGDYGNAVSLYQQSIEYRPYDHFTYSNLAQIYLKMKKYQFAQWCAHRAIWIDHSWPKSHYRFIQALDCQGYLLKAWNVSTVVADMAENNGCCFTGGEELLQDLIKQRNCLTTRVHELKLADKDSVELKSSKNKKQRAKSKSNVSAASTTDFACTEKSSEKESTLPSEHLKGISTAQKAVTNNMPHGSEITSPVNVGAHVGKAKFNIQNFKKLLQDGSEALMMLSYKVAHQKYSAALSMMENSKGKKACGLSELNVIVLKYCYAKACIGKGTNEDINMGLKVLDEIINDHYTVSFPLSYYGKALGFIAQNRYKEARSPLQSLCSIIDNKLKLDVYEFPNCESKIIEESHPEKLQELVKDLVAICNAPPPPNAVCRYNTNDSSHRNEIYFSEPEFQGFAQIICQEKCQLSYHMHCWKEIKEEKKMHFEKDFLGKPCFTPDCNSSISRVELFGADGMKRKTFPSEDEIKPKVKDSGPSKPPKEIKKIKPIVRKISHVTDKVTAERLSEHRQSDSSIEEKRNDFAVADTRQNAVLVLQKKFMDDGNPQNEKKKQSKKKLKEVLPLDFAKTDDPRIEQLKTIKVAAEKDFSNALPPSQFQLDPDHPFALPPHVRGNVAETEKWLHDSFNGISRMTGSEVQENFIGQYSTISGKEERQKWLQEYFKQMSNTEMNDSEQNFIRQFKNGWITDGIKCNDAFSNEYNTFSSESKNHLPDSLTQALDLALKDDSQKMRDLSSIDMEQKIKRSSSYAHLPSTTKLAEGKNVENKIGHRQTYASVGSYSNTSELSEALGNNHQSDDFSDEQDSVSELSDITDDIGKKYSINSINSKYKFKFGALENRGLKDITEIKNESGSQPKRGIGTSSYNGYLHSEENSNKSFETINNEERSITCTSCLQYASEIESLQETNLHLTSQSQEFMDRLCQAQNELQVTKKATESNANDLKEELEKYKKLYNNIQSNYDSNSKKLEAEKKKLNTDIKSFTDKINTLNFEKDELVAKQCKLEEMISLKQSSMEEERKLRFKAEDDAKTAKSSWEIMEASYKQVLNNEIALVEKVNSQEAQIKDLLSKLDIMQKSFRLRPPPVFDPVGYQGRPIPPGRYMPMPPMPDRYRQQFHVSEGYANFMAGNKTPLLPLPMRPVHYDPRSFQYRPYPGPNMQYPPGNDCERETENNQAAMAGTTLTSPPKLPSASDSPADLPSSPSNTPSPHHTPSGFSPELSQIPQLPLKNKQISKIDVAGTSRSVENLAAESSFSAEHRGSLSKAPLLYSAAAAMQSKQESGKTSYGKLMQLLHKEFPTIKKAGLSKYISKTRSKHNNSLTGMTLGDIVHEIREAIFVDHASKGAIPKDSSRQWPTSPKLNAMGLDKFEEIPFSWGVPQTPESRKRYYGSSDECYICYELMEEGDLHNLSCGHAYHSECIKRWFEVDNTCPTCRLYAPLEEEYPTL